jgi:hypothetical protein
MEIGKPVNRPDQDDTHNTAKPRVKDPGTGRARGTPQYGLADADIRARTGTEKEDVRNTPPAGKWNDTARNE